MASSSMKRDPALVPVVAALWLALGVFIIYPFIRLLAVTFTAEDGGLSRWSSPTATTGSR